MARKPGKKPQVIIAIILFIRNATMEIRLPPLVERRFSHWNRIKDALMTWVSTELIRLNDQFIARRLLD